MIEKNIYSTKSLQIASYLYACDLQLISTSKINKEIIFIFSPKTKAEELIHKYFLGTALINPRDLFASINDLKDLIFNERRTNE